MSSYMLRRVWNAKKRGARRSRVGGKITEGPEEASMIASRMSKKKVEQKNKVSNTALGRR